MEIVAGPALTVQIEDYRINKALLQIRTVRYVRYHSFFSFWLQANLKIRNDPIEDVPAHGTEQPPCISSVKLDHSHPDDYALQRRSSRQLSFREVLVTPFIFPMIDLLGEARYLRCSLSKEPPEDFKISS